MKLADSLKNLGSRQELERLARKLMELEAEQEVHKLESIKPNPGFQEAFIKSKARIRLCSCGNQIGKTYIAAYEHACFALGRHPHKEIKIPNRGLIVTAKSFKDGIQDEVVPALQKVCGSRDIERIKNSPQGIPTTIYWKGGSVTYLMSAEQDDVAFESKTLHHAWFDEPMRRAIYIGVSRGMLTTGGSIWFTCTPLDEPWMYDEIYMPGKSGKNPMIEVFEGASDENVAISKEEKTRFFSQLTQDEIETRWYGKFRHLAGRVFKEYNPENNRIPPFDIPEHWPVWAAIDPHRNKPHAVGFIAVSPQNKFYLCNEVYHKCTIHELAAIVLDLGSQYNLVNILIDTSAQEDGWARMSAREMLEEKGVRTKLAQKKNLKADGIIHINQLFRDQRLYLFETCVRAHREFMLQTFPRNKRDDQKVLEEPEKKYDDLTDVCRYVLSERPDYRGAPRVKEYGPVYVRG